MHPSTTHRRGLGNIANNCYLNSAFQALRHVRPFAELFRGTDWSIYSRSDKRGHSLAHNTSALMTAVWSPDVDPLGRRTVLPSQFVRSFVEYAQACGIDEIRFGAQADASEALQLLVDGLHTHISREVTMRVTGSPTEPARIEYKQSVESWASFFHKEYSKILDIFYGQTQARLTCNKCGHTSTSYTPWGSHKVEIPGATTPGAPAPPLKDCIAASFAKELLDGYRCDGCKEAGTTEKTLCISKFPPYMILVIKRFTASMQKVRARIPYNEADVDFSDYITWPTIQKTTAAHYRVVSTIEHLGGTRGGHYVMRTRDDYTEGVDPEWLIYDDGNVTKSPIGGAATPDTYVMILERHEKGASIMQPPSEVAATAAAAAAESKETESKETNETSVTNAK
jgi:ubiquitin C-terminal hydrolase